MGGNDESRSIRILEEAHTKHPYGRDILFVLANFNKAMGNMPTATMYANKQAAMDPRYGSADQIMQKLSSP